MEDPRQGPALWKHSFNTPRANEGEKHSLDFFLDPLTPGFGSWLIVDSGDLNHQVTPLQDKSKHERLHTYNGAIWSNDLLN